MTRWIALDTETTGLDPRTEDVFEVAAVEDDGTEHVWTIEPFARVVEAMHPKALEVNRYHERTGADGWIWDARRSGSRDDMLGTLNSIRYVLDGAHIVGAVPDFDTRHLTHLFESEFVALPRWHYHLIDVEVLAVGWLLREPLTAGQRQKLDLPWKSDDLAALCGVEPPSDDERHTALGDARWVARWYRTLTNMESEQ